MFVHSENCQLETGGNNGNCCTFSKASSVFSGLAFRAWEASMMGMGIKRMVKFLMDTHPEGIILQVVTRLDRVR